MPVGPSLVHAIDATGDIASNKSNAASCFEDDALQIAVAVEERLQPHSKAKAKAYEALHIHLSLSPT